MSGPCSELEASGASGARGIVEVSRSRLRPGVEAAVEAAVEAGGADWESVVEEQVWEVVVELVGVGESAAAAVWGFWRVCWESQAARALWSTGHLSASDIVEVVEVVEVVGWWGECRVDVEVVE